MNLYNWILRVAQNDDEEIATDCRDLSFPTVVQNDEGVVLGFFLQSLVRTSHNYLTPSLSPPAPPRYPKGALFPFVILRKQSDRRIQLKKQQ